MIDSFRVIGLTKDLRTQTDVVYTQIAIKEYFDLIGENYNKFQLQRRKESHRGYKRLKEDLSKGALIPGITLAIEPSIAKSVAQKIDQGDLSSIANELKKAKDNIYILDGLQRTHKIKELIDSGIKFQQGHDLLLEIWVEPEISHLVYRLIVLNSGQKPMSMRHQIELLFTTMRVTLTKEIPSLDILVENEESKRVKALQFPFERIVTAYYSYLMKSPEVDKSSIVSQKLVEEKIMEGSEQYLSESFSSFKNYLKKYCELDKELFRICDKTELKTYRNWFADANVINAFFAAVGKLQDIKPKRVETAISVLNQTLKGAGKGNDILNLKQYSIIREEVADPKFYNVGYATRLLLSKSFDEFFRDEGDRSLYDCWIEISSTLKKTAS